MKWSERNITHALAKDFFGNQNIVLVPNCTWTGNECDLLVVTQDLRIIDIEVKISQSDFKNDILKEKWWDSYVMNESTGRYQRLKPPQKRTHPVKVWKHYYAMPKEIWKPELAEFLPSENCGIILLSVHRNKIIAELHKRAIPNRKADEISAHDAINIARLGNIRMWNAYEKLDKLNEIS
jgi:hypothetical protein